MDVSLIVGRHDDPHTEAVSKELRNLGRKVFCLDTSRCDSIAINISSKNAKNNRSIFGDLFDGNIKSIWLRQKPIAPLPWWSPLQHDAARFSQGEWRALIQSLETFLPSAFWINSPEKQRGINYKPKQLELAISAGFNIPDTIITNDPNLVDDFLKLHQKIIYKSISGYIFTDQTAILTSIVTRESIENNIESIKKAPGIYQQFVEKKHEVRITVVGRRHFTAYIQTPKTGPANIDWRHAHFEDIFIEGHAPENIVNSIKTFQRLAGIHYGAYDFIVSTDGSWYFLECNPAGQFLWIENALGYKISAAIAEDLINL